MPEKKKFRIADLLTLLSLICLATMLLSIFLPLAKMQLPIVGSQNVSAFSAVSRTWESQRTGEKKASLVDAQRMVTDKEGEDIFREKPIYRFIPIGGVLGVIAHVLLVILVFEFFFLKKALMRLIVAGGAFVSSLGFLVSLFLLDDALRYVMQSSMKELEDNPFAGLAQAFVGGVKVEPAIASYLLIGGTFLIFVFKWIERNYELD